MSVGLTKRILLADFVFTGVFSCEHYPLHRNSPLRYVAPTLVNHQTAFHFKKTCKTRYTHLRRDLYRQSLTPSDFIIVSCAILCNYRTSEYDDFKQLTRKIEVLRDKECI